MPWAAVIPAVAATGAAVYGVYSQKRQLDKIDQERRRQNRIEEKALAAATEEARNKKYPNNSPRAEETYSLLGSPSSQLISEGGIAGFSPTSLIIGGGVLIGVLFLARKH